MKRTILTLSLVASVSLIVGCGGDGEGSDSKSNESTPQVDANAFAKAKGKMIYNKSCIACHGEGGLGVEGLGKNWTTSEFIKSKTDHELLEFIKVGRPIDDPLSDGIAPMPARGGDTTLTDEDLSNVIVYMRTLQK